MSLGPKILLSIFSLSLVIATIGVTSNWYTNSILNQLVQKNVETTSMVEQTAKLENRLYQSLILLIELKESRSEVIPTIELQSPTEKVLIQNFGANIAQIKSYIIELEGTISVHHELYQFFAVLLDIQKYWIYLGEYTDHSWSINVISGSQSVLNKIILVRTISTLKQTRNIF